MGNRGPGEIEVVQAAAAEDPADESRSSADVPQGVLTDITSLLASGDSPDRVVAAVTDALAEVVPYDVLSLFQVDTEQGVLRSQVVLGGGADEALAPKKVRFGRGITGVAAETRTPQMANDVHLDPRADHASHEASEPGSMLAIPLLARDELKGVLSLHRRRADHNFSVGEFKQAILFSELAALAIDNAEIRAKLEAEVVTDHLTGLYNHRYFHERLAEELRRANRQRTPVGLLIYDIDDFKRVNDTHGHLAGDLVLQRVATFSREACRAEDVVCRVGGEEFAVILPGTSIEDAASLAERIRDGIAAVTFPGIGQVSVSVGVAEGPLHASGPRELMSCADIAMLEAKIGGKNRVVAFQPMEQESDTGERGARLASLAARDERRSLAHLRLLQGLSMKLNRLNDVARIGETMIEELQSLIDYHNCRVHLLSADGGRLVPIAFRGTLTEYSGETFEALVTEVGEGMTGRVALTGQSYYTPNASQDPYAVTITGTPDVEESILIVPLKAGQRVAGTVTLSKLGLDQFDQEDMRLLEALAANAAIAIENAWLLEREREAAEVSGALLKLSQALTRLPDGDKVLDEALHAIPGLIASQAAGAWMRHAETGDFRMVHHHGFDPQYREMLDRQVVPAKVAQEFLLSVEEPFVLPAEIVAEVPPEFVALEKPRPCLVAPMRWEPEGVAILVVVAADRSHEFSPRDLRLIGGIADIASLAMGAAARFLERERAYVSTVEALAQSLEAEDELDSDVAETFIRLLGEKKATLRTDPQH